MRREEPRGTPANDDLPAKRSGESGAPTFIEDREGAADTAAQRFSSRVGGSRGNQARCRLNLNATSRPNAIRTAVPGSGTAGAEFETTPRR